LPDRIEYGLGAIEVGMVAQSVPPGISCTSSQRQAGGIGMQTV
jgi:hypothetical protein